MRLYFPKGDSSAEPFSVKGLNFFTSRMDEKTFQILRACVLIESFPGTDIAQKACQDLVAVPDTVMTKCIEIFTHEMNRWASLREKLGDTRPVLLSDLICGQWRSYEREREVADKWRLRREARRKRFEERVAAKRKRVGDPEDIFPFWPETKAWRSERAEKDLRERWERRRIARQLDQVLAAAPVVRQRARL